MAKATFRCSKCSDDVGFVARNRKEATRQAEWFEKRERLCSVCEKNADAEKAVFLEKKHNMPELKGTEKQVAWAKQIRYGRMMWLLKTTENGGAFNKSEKDIAQKVIEVILSKDTASFWIDVRSDSLDSLFDRLCRVAPGDVTPIREVLKPDSQNSEMVVTIGLRGHTVYATSDQPDESLNSVLKIFGCQWSAGEWVRTIPNLVEIYGTATDRAADLVTRVIACGFKVICLDPVAADFAKSADFQKEIIRYCALVSAKDSLCLKFEKNEELFNQLKSLPGARYDRSIYAFVILAWRAAEIREFCEENGFSITQGAEKRLSACEKALASGVTIKAKPRKTSGDLNREDILSIPEGIDPSLLDV